MQLPRADKDWLMAAPSFKRSPVAPVLSARSLKKKRSVSGGKIAKISERCDITFTNAKNQIFPAYDDA